MTDQPQQPPQNRPERAKNWFIEFGENVLLGAAILAAFGVLKTFGMIGKMVGEQMNGKPKR